MTLKDTQPAEPEFTIGGDDDSTNMSAMPVTDPSMAPTMEEIQQDTSIPTPNFADGANNPPPASSAYPNIASPSASFAASQAVDRSMFGPTGRWRKGIFSFFEVFFSSLFWMGWCCTPCVYGQLMQRLNLSWTGQALPPGHRAAGTCMFVFVFTAIAYCFIALLKGWMVTIVWYLFCFYFFFMGILLRSVIRKRFGIAPPTVPACDGVLEDFFLAFCCSCCSSIQMARHTHDEHRYPYNACSNNGLMSYAPELWDSFENDSSIGTNPHVNPHSTTAVMSPNALSSPSEGGYMSNVEIV